MKKEPLIACIGQNIQFVAFFAHAGVAAYVVSRWLPSWQVALAITVAAGVKEFWYDAKYEKDPPQTFMDNFQDFIGWAVGAWIGLL